MESTYARMQSFPVAPERERHRPTLGGSNLAGRPQERSICTYEIGLCQ
jgi:hypothetical protein